MKYMEMANTVNSNKRHTLIYRNDFNNIKNLLMMKADKKII